MNSVYAHDGVAHDSGLEATGHYLEILTDPFVATALFLAILIASHNLMEYFGLPKPTMALLMLLLLFVGVVLGFSFVPFLGLVSVIAGFGYAGLLVFVGIKKGE
jgi:hypothetical protein